MILSEKSLQNLSDYFQSFLVFFNLIKKGIDSGEKIRNSGNYNDDYDHSFFGRDSGFLIQAAILVILMIMLTRSSEKILTLS